MRGGTTVTVFSDSQDKENSQISNHAKLVVEGVSRPVQPFDGQWFLLEVESVTLAASGRAG